MDKNDDQHQGNPNTTTHSVPEEPSQPVINPVLVSQPAQPLVLPQPSPAQRGGALVPPPYQTNPQLPVVPPTVPPSTAGATIVPQSNSQSSNGSTNNLNNNQPIPALQVEEYLETKMKLAQIMRDFNEKKICFVGVDGGRIYVQQYQQISARVKNGEDISMFLRGRIVMFVTAVDKKKRSITETKLFIPDFELMQR